MKDICRIEVKVLLMPFYFCERFDDGLLIFTGARHIMLAKATSSFARMSGDSFQWTPQCAGIHWSVTSTRAFNLGMILMRLVKYFFGVFVCLFVCLFVCFCFCFVCVWFFYIFFF